MSVDIYRQGPMTTYFIVHQHKGKIIRHRTYEEHMGKEGFKDSVIEIEKEWSRLAEKERERAKNSKR